MRRRPAHGVRWGRAPGVIIFCLIVGPATAGAVLVQRMRGGQDQTSRRIQHLSRHAPADSRSLLRTPDKAWRDGASLLLLGRNRGLRGGGATGSPPAARKATTSIDIKSRTTESDALLAGNVQRLQFLRKKTGIDLGVTVFSLYAMAIRSVVATVGQPQQAARERREGLFLAAQAENVVLGHAAQAATAATASASALSTTETLVDDAVGLVGAAAEAAAREGEEPLPFPYLPSVGAMLLVMAAVVAHALLVLGKKWSVRFHAWSSFEEVSTWEQADAVLVTPVRHTGTPAICPLVGTPRSRGDIPPGCDGDKEEEEEEGKRAGEGSEAEGKNGAAESGDPESATSESEEESLSRQGSSSEEPGEEGANGEGTKVGDSEEQSEEGAGDGATRGGGGCGGEGRGADASVDVGAEGDADLPSFMYQRRKFVLKRAASAAAGPCKADVEEEEEEGDHGVERGVGDTFGLVELPIGWPLGRYLQARGLGLEDVPSRLGLFGANSVDVEQPSFWHHLVERLSNPFVVFRLFNQVLWMLEEYWTKALLGFGEIVGVEAAFVADSERRRKQLDIQNAKRPVKKVKAWRGGRWVAIPVSGMLPGDVVSLKSGVSRTAGHRGDGGEDERNGKGVGNDDDEAAPAAAFDVGELPADVLLLRGTAVVDESTLTGESVPQIKTSLTSEPIDFEEDLDMTGRHSGHVLLSGTTLLDQTDGSSGFGESDFDGTSSAAPWSSSLPESTPDGGALCYVLRTGAYSFQGDLRRTIDFGSHGIRDDSKQSAYLLGFLLSFAALSSAHVVKEGLRLGKLSGFQLLLQCVRILSSVVPGGLQFDLNQCMRNGVLSLQKGHALACTEPFRVPLAGKVDVCLFDKTGTITSDKLRAETLVTPQQVNPDGPPTTVSLGGSPRRGDTAPSSGLSAEVVIGGCHSLMDVDGALHGDPLEVSALEGIRWSWNATSHTASPRSEDTVGSKPASAVSGGSAGGETATEKVKRGKNRRKSKKGDVDGVGEEPGVGSGVAATVWRRYAFSSQLQRMSVIAEVSGGGGAGGGADLLTGAEAGPEAWVLSKGSPEAMRPLLDRKNLPSWYDSEYDRLARSGRRVVALAHRSLGPSRAQGAKSELMTLTRAEVESEGALTFDGFLSFHCRTRADSKRVVRELREAGDCSVTIVTGDSVLTACHVAAEIGLIDGAPTVPAPTVNNDTKTKTKGNGKSSAAGKARAKNEAKNQAAGQGEGEESQAAAAPSKRGKRSSGRGGAGGGRSPLLLTVVPAEHGEELRWVPLHPGDAATTVATEGAEEGARQSDGSDGQSREFSWEGVEGLAATRDLCVTGPAFELALADEDPAIGSAVQHFRVLARMTPALKEELATLLMDAGKTVLMCGDGSNDVGALRRSHVGLALLSGFGDANTRTDDSPPAATKATSGVAPSSAVSPKEGKEEDGDGGGGAGRGVTVGQAKKRAADTIKRERQQVQDDVNLEFERLRSKGVGAGKAMWQASTTANKKHKSRAAARKEASRGDFAASAMAMFQDADGGDGGGGGADAVVRTGDASLAAPFTSKKPSIAAVVDVIREGRCTQAAVVHTYQIVALQALFNSYTSSVLYLMDVRWAIRPFIVVSMVYVHMSLGMASPKTPTEMSPVRPPSSVFHRSIAVSLVAQAGIHVACMVFALRAAKAHSPEVAPVKTKKSLLGPKFVPHLASNVVFLLSSMQSVSVAVVNFKGRPFMAGILETPQIFLPAMSIVVFCFILVLEIMPRVNALLELKAFPSAAARLPILASMIVSLAGPLAVDRLCVKLFDPELHKARKAGPPLKSVEKFNIALLGVLLLGMAVVVNMLDFDSLEETYLAAAESP